MGRRCSKKYETRFKSCEAQAIVALVEPNTGPWGRALFVVQHAAPPCHYGTISPGASPGWTYGHVAACLALSPSERAIDDSGRLRPVDLSRAHPAAPTGAPLHAAYRRGLARGGSHHAAARRRQGSEGIR